MFIPNFTEWKSWLKRFNMASFGPSLTPDTWDKSLSLDNVNDEVDFGDVYDKDGSSAFSIGLWINLNWQNSSFLTISKLNSGGNFNGWELGINGSTGKPYLFLISVITTNMIQADCNTAIADADWSHLVMTYDGSKNTSGIKWYIDGTQATTVSTTNNLTGSTSSSGLKLKWNKRQAAINGSPGPTIYKEVAFWNRELTQDDVDEFYNSGNPVNSMAMTNPPNHRWTCGNTTGDDATPTTGQITDDGSTGGLNGTPFNNAGTFSSNVP